ncbi:hypothetical protein ACVTOK_004548, partial [Vibrio alginolyticus]
IFIKNEVSMGKYKEVVVNDSIKAFGIEIESRAGKINEICEMLEFVKDLAEKDLVSHVKSLFYDSKGNICTVEFNTEIEEYTDLGQAFCQCASTHFSKSFMMFGKEYYN